MPPARASAFEAQRPVEFPWGCKGMGSRSFSAAAPGGHRARRLDAQAHGQEDLLTGRGSHDEGLDAQAFFWR